MPAGHRLAMALRLYPWELPQPGLEAPPELPPPPPPPAPQPPHAGAAQGQEGETEAAREERENKEEAGRELAEVLLQLHVDGQLTAKSACVIAHWASKAGAVGPAARLAFRPNAPTGHFQRHLDAVAGLRGKPGVHYPLPVPGHSKHSAARVVHNVKVLLPHECLHAEVTEDPDLVAKARDTPWPPSFGQHAAVQGAVRTAIPLAFYLDGTQYATRGQLLVFVVCNLVSGARHLCCVLKKKDMCRCGCKGWCSAKPIMDMFAWSFAALARGVFPAATHDGSQWGEQEPLRRSLAGRPLSLVGAVCQVKGDWAEFAHTLAFPTWRSADYPCLWRRCDRDSMYSWEGVEHDSLPWGLVGEADYEAACRRCEVHVVVQTEAQRAQIVAALYYDKRQQGSNGRALNRALPEFRLEAHDRLEPGGSLRDVGALETLGLPATIVFWRPRLETLAKHRNPIFTAATGISVRTLCADTLHCLYLGIFQAHCSRVLWGMIGADVWETRQQGNTHAVERLQESCIRLQAELRQWCASRRRSHPHEVLTEVHEIHYKQLGEKDDQKLALKGGETKTMLLFLQDKLGRCAGSVEHGAHMLAAGAAILRHIRLMKDAQHAFTDAERREFHETQMEALAAMGNYCSETPKFHQWLHMGRGGENPSYHSCWLNESDNRKIARIAESSHRRVFEERVLASWALLQSEGSFKLF